MGSESSWWPDSASRKLPKHNVTYNEFAIKLPRLCSCSSLVPSQINFSERSSPTAFKTRQVVRNFSDYLLNPLFAFKSRAVLKISGPPVGLQYLWASLTFNASHISQYPGIPEGVNDRLLLFYTSHLRC